ncbi:alpha/beta fold hydrolase [Cellulomonas sp. P22]|uniref:alpha/beta fold hydrolase n=1 Tax=Cellulomonas sp. P22 TaxID=3373189 RepID=UPI00379B4885
MFTPVHVEIVGDGGDPILLLPGGGVRDPEYLGDVARWGAGRAVAVVHFRGTPATGGLPRPWWDQRDDLDSVRRALGVDSVDVLAHSSGTRVALAYAASGAPVRRLGLITPPATWLTGGADDIAELAEPRLGEPAIRAALAAPPLDLSDEDRFREQQRVTAPLGYATWNDAARRHAQTGSTNLGALRAFFGAPPPGPLLEVIAALSLPIHVVGGAADLLSGNRPVRELASMFREGTVEMIEGSGHYPWIDQPAAFNDAIARWVSG